MSERDYNIKDFKDTEIGRIPKEWEIKKIKDVSTYITDGTHKTPHYIKYNQFAIPFISTENIKPYSSEYDFSRYRRYIDEISYKELSKRAKAEKGDLLVSKCGTIGRTQLIRNNFKIGIFVGLLLIKINNNIINGEYLENLLNSDKFRKIMESKSTGSTRKTLAINIFKNITIPIPPLEEQKRIADILSTVDEKINLIDSEIQLTEKLKNGIMHKLFTEGVGHTEFKDTEIGRIPKEWEIIPASKIATYYNGYPFKPSQWEKHGLPIIRIQNLTNSSDIIHYFEGTLDKRYQIDKGDLLLSWSATLNTYIWKGPIAYLNQHIFKVVPNKIVDKYYLYFSLLMVINKFKGQTHGSTMKHFVKSAISDVLIPIPPLEEQKRIADILSTIDEKLELLNLKKQNLENLKKGLMEDLLTGKVRVKISGN